MNALTKSALKFFIIAGSAWLAACSSGNNAYRQGDYLRASTEAVQRLRTAATNKKARAVLESAYPLCVTDALRRTEANRTARDLARLESNIGIYNDMNDLADLIFHTPAALTVIPSPRTFHPELAETKNLVAGLYYDEGVAAMGGGTLESARAAYGCFSKTAFYAPKYRDVQARLAEARAAATVHVVVTRPVTNRGYQLDAEFFYDKLMETITARTFRNLIRFYTPEEASAERLARPNQVIDLDFADFTVGNSRQTTNTTEVHRDSVLVGTTKVNGKDQNVYGTVKAKFTVNRLEVMSAGVLGVRIVNPATGRVVSQRDFANRFVWYSEWASFNGDERALTREQKAMVGRRPLPVPPPQEHFRGFAMPLYMQAADFISSVYASY